MQGGLDAIGTGFTFDGGDQGAPASTLAGLLPDGVLLTDLNGKIAYVNRALVQLLGAGAGELIGTDAAQWFAPSARESRAERLRMVAAGRAVHGSIEAVVGRTGRIVPVEVDSAPLERNGRRYSLSVLRDVSLRLERERSLLSLSRELESTNRRLVESARTAEANAARYSALAAALPGTMVMVFGRDLVVRMASGGALVGRPGAEAAMVGRHLSEVTFPPNVAVLTAALAAAFEGEATSTELTSSRSGGVNIVDVVSLDTGRGSDEALVVARDITWLKDREREIAAGEARWRAAFDDAPVGVAEVGLDGRFLRVNEALAAILQTDPAATVGRPVSDFADPAVRSTIAAKVALLSPGSAMLGNSEWRIVGAQGGRRWVNVRSSRLEATGDLAERLLLHVIDISEVRHQRLKIESAHARFAALIERSTDAIVVIGTRREVAFASPALGDLVGRNVASTLGQPFALLIHADDRADVDAQLSGLDAGASVTFHCRFVGPAQRWRHAEVTASDRRGDGVVNGIVVNARDVTDRVEDAARLAHQATHDPLTQLPNRALLLERLAAALARCDASNTRCAAIFLDLDGFKQVNDSLGHAVGDELLRAVAARISAAIRPGDSAARLGGDEFVVLAEDVADEDTAIAIAERLADQLRDPVVLGRRSLVVGTSIGIAISERNTPETLLQEADMALYQAKAKGRNRWEVYDRAMRTAARRRLQVEGMVRNAIDGDGLRIHYQPVVDLATGGIVGTEALARIARPGGRLVDPDEFIPVAEDSGLIGPLGAAVLRAACAQQALWRRSGGPEMMAVNVSARELVSADFVVQLVAMLRHFGLGPSSLCLEITETAIIDAGSGAQEQLAALRALGLRLALDDFGTGWSSLAYLRRYPFDAIKIDRSFVAGLGTEAEDTEVVRAVIGLGRALRLTTIAEGVETLEQHRLLASLGCDQAQGYLYGRPVPAAGRWALTPAP